MSSHSSPSAASSDCTTGSDCLPVRLLWGCQCLHFRSHLQSDLRYVDKINSAFFKLMTAKQPQEVSLTDGQHISTHHSVSLTTPVHTSSLNVLDSRTIACHPLSVVVSRAER